MKLFRILVPGVLLVLVGCGSGSVQRVPQPDVARAHDHPEMARIVLLRDHQPFGMLSDLEVYDGNTLVGTIDRDAYLCWERLPGPVRMRMVLIRPGMQSLQGISSLEVRPGRTHSWLVRLDDINRRPTILELGEDQAAEILPDRKLAPVR